MGQDAIRDAILLHYPFLLKISRILLATSFSSPGSFMNIVKTIALPGKQGTFTFPLEAAPLSVVLDPNTTLLMDAGAFVRR